MEGEPENSTILVGRVQCLGFGYRRHFRQSLVHQVRLELRVDNAFSVQLDQIRAEESLHQQHREEVFAVPARRVVEDCAVGLDRLVIDHQVVTRCELWNHVPIQLF